MHGLGNMTPKCEGRFANRAVDLTQQRYPSGVVHQMGEQQNVTPESPEEAGNLELRSSCGSNVALRHVEDEKGSGM